MEFIIKCSNCGAEQAFNSDSDCHGEQIMISVITRGSYQGEIVESVDFDCNNPQCLNGIVIDIH